jgi:hypothetical protein
LEVEIGGWRLEVGGWRPEVAGRSTLPVRSHTCTHSGQQQRFWKTPQPHQSTRTRTHACARTCRRGPARAHGLEKAPGSPAPALPRPDHEWRPGGPPVEAPAPGTASATGGAAARAQRRGRSGRTARLRACMGRVKGTRLGLGEAGGGGATVAHLHAHSMAGGWGKCFGCWGLGFQSRGRGRSAAARFRAARRTDGSFASVRGQ